MTASKKYCLDQIRRERNRCYQEPVWTMKKSEFERISIHNWAVNTILELLQKNAPNVYDADTYYRIVEDFMIKMDECACKNREHSYWFSTAKDAAEWILDVLISFNERL